MRASATKHSTQLALAIAFGFRTFEGSASISSFLTGSSIFLPDSVRGMALIWKMSLGTCRGDSAVHPFLYAAIKAPLAIDTVMTTISGSTSFFSTPSMAMRVPVRPEGQVVQAPPW